MSLEWLDDLGSTANSLATAYADVTNANAAKKVADAQIDQASAKPVASAQVSLSGSGSTLLWVVIGLVVIGGAVYLIRR